MKPWMNTSTDIYVFGMGKTGYKSACYFCRKGHRVRIFDSRSLPPFSEELCNEHDIDVVPFLDVPDNSAVLVSSSIPVDHPWVVALQEKGCELFTDLEVFAACNRSNVIAVTGTNGKTTVCSWLVSCLQASGYRAAAIGNIGRPVLDVDSDHMDWWVIELSSYQLKWLKDFRVNIGVILNIAPDHLDWHQTFEDYRSSKMKLVHFSDTCLLPNKKEGFSDKSGAKFFAVSQSGEWNVNGNKIADVPDLPELPHDRLNLAAVLSVLSVAKIDVPWSFLSQLTKDRFRAEYWCDPQGVHWYNDSKATNISAAHSILQYCQERYSGRCHWIAGGVLKENTCTDWHVRPDWVGLFGRDRQKIKNLLVKNSLCEEKIRLEEIIMLVKKRVRRGDVVVFAPACSSFDQYGDYCQRGEHFKELIHES